MIPQIIKDKFKLEPAWIHTPKSMASGCEFALWPQLCFYFPNGKSELKVYVADCDRLGDALSEGMLMVMAIGGKYCKTIQITIEMLQDLEPAVAVQFVKSNMSIYTNDPAEQAQQIINSGL